MITGEATIHIEAPPDVVYDLVSDVTRMGEWSPECYRCEWQDGATGPAVGARFKGWNRKGLVRWSNRPTVTAADRPRQFGFNSGATQWTYRIEPADGGSRVTESFEELQAPGPARRALYRVVVGADRPGQLCRGMQATLERIKAAAESRSPA